MDNDNDHESDDSDGKSDSCNDEAKWAKSHSSYLYSSLILYNGAKLFP